jgi:hypothetical protein
VQTSFSAECIMRMETLKKLPFLAFLGLFSTCALSCSTKVPGQGLATIFKYKNY